MTGKKNNRNEKSDCIFCLAHTRFEIVAEHGEAVAVRDRYPVTENHLLLLPKRHISDYFDLTDDEKRDIDRLLSRCRKLIEDEDAKVTGFNIGVNCGESAGQTIFHCHVHLIPRRDGDTPSPRGGVRGVIPEKRSYPVEIKTNPEHYGLPPRTQLKRIGDDTIAILVHRKSRIIMADGKKLLEKARQIQKTAPQLRVALITSAPVCSKTADFLEANSIPVQRVTSI